VIINGAAWGQCDAIYTAFCLGSLYFILADRPAWACILFGLALSFKLQAVFFAPVLLLLFLRGKRAARHGNSANRSSRCSSRMTSHSVRPTTLVYDP